MKGTSFNKLQEERMKGNRSRKERGMREIGRR